MPNALPLIITVAALPRRNYEPQELAAAIAERLTISSEDSFSLFQSGATRPGTNVGMFFNTTLNQWESWNEETGEYSPISLADQSLGYILQLDDGNNANDPDPDLYRVWVVLAPSGQATDIRTFYDSDWRSFLVGTANAVAAFGPEGTGLQSITTNDTGRVLVSRGATTAPQYRYAAFDIGDIKWSGRSTPRAGWLSCDGSAISRTLYADLFAEYGTTFGVGDGSTTFNLPNLPGRVVVSKGNGAGLTARSLAQTGGEETHVLTEAEMPAHTHTLAETTRTDNQDGGADTTWLIPGSGRSTGSSGSGTAHNTMPPFIVLNAFVYTGIEA